MNSSQTVGLREEKQSPAFLSVKIHQSSLHVFSAIVNKSLSGKIVVAFERFVNVLQIRKQRTRTIT